MKPMKVETGDTIRTPSKVCRGCFEAHIPISQELCGECSRRQKLETFVRNVAGLGLAVTRSDDCEMILREVIQDALALADDV